MSHEKVKATFAKCCRENKVGVDVDSIFDDILAFFKGILEMCTAVEVKKLAQENPRIFERRAARYFDENGHTTAESKKLAKASRETALKTSAVALQELEA